MKTEIVIALIVGLAWLPASAFASGTPGPPWDFEFTYVAPTGGPTDIPDDSVRWYSLDLTLAPPSPDYTITYLELEIVGLSHDRPEDLNIFLLDPLGEGIEVMDDAGDGFSVGSLTLVYLPDGPEAFTDYDGTEVGTASWFFVMIDDAVGDSGSFESVSLHGTAVPEPVTLSLLAVGALVTLRRRRR